MTTIQPASHALTPTTASTAAAVVKPESLTPVPVQPAQGKAAISATANAPTELSPQQQAAMAAISERPELSIDLAEMRKQLDEAIARLNKQLQSNQTNLGFSVDSETDILTVRVTNKETGELVRQIPAEALVRLAETMEDLKGLLVDENL